MKSIKPGRGPSKMSAVGSVFASVFGIFWCRLISKWENGTAVPVADMLCRIAEALDVSVVDLLG